MTDALTSWQRDAYESLRGAFDRGQLGHATLLTGAVDIGKRRVADALAAYILCSNRSAGDACGECRTCRLRLAGTHPDLRIVALEMNKENTKLRTEIVIDQLRAVSASLALTPQMGGAQIVIVDPADLINRAGANALLKTLEEPMPDRFLWLLSSNPGHLPQTIRSRCQKVEMPMPSHAEALAWLSTSGTSDVDAETALKAAKGHPVLALDWLQNGGMALRTRIQKDLDALAQSRTLPSEVAEAWMLEDPALCLRFAAELAVDRAAALPPSNESRALAAWFDAANRSRALLRTPIRPNLILTELLVDWCRRMVPLNKERHA